MSGNPSTFWSVCRLIMDAAGFAVEFDYAAHGWPDWVFGVTWICPLFAITLAFSIARDLRRLGVDV